MSVLGAAENDAERQQLIEAYQHTTGAIRGLLEDALRKIAAPKRPDGTYNLSREACEQIAVDALGKRRWL